MTNTPVAGWYHDPEVPGRYRYWDGARWTEHLAAPPTATPAPPQPPAAPTPTPFYTPQPFQGFGTPPAPPNVTLYSNPYQLPPRAKRHATENALSGPDRVRAAAIDAALVIPFVALGFVLGPLLGWISGNSSSQHHAYQAAAIVVAVVLGVGTVAWNFLIRETTLGTELVSRNRRNEESEDQAP